MLYWWCVVCSLTTPPIVHSGLACVQFYYYMWGQDVDQLTVSTRNLGLDYSWLTLSGHHGETWWPTAVSVSLTNNTDRVMTDYTRWRKNIIGVILRRFHV